MTSRILRWDVFFKSFFIQTAWNVERMQNVGFLFSVRKSLKRIWAGHGNGFDSACARASGFFNTHPYFAPALMGVTLHLEQKIADGRALPENVELAKARLSAPLAALGSLWFWDHLKMLCFLAALPCLAMGHPAAIAAGAALFFVSFNVQHLRTRWVGLELGLRHGEGMVHELLARFPSHRLPVFRRLSAFLLGASAPLVLMALYGLFQHRLPGLLDVEYLPEAFSLRVLSGLGVMGVAMVVIHRRWLSVYQFLSLAMLLGIGVARWA